MTPSQAAQAISAGFVASPSGKVGVVSKPGASTSPLQTLLGFAKTTALAVGDVFGPSDFNVPGTAPIARAAANGVQKVTGSVVRGVDKVSEKVGEITGAVATTVSSAGEGVKSGFKWATIVLVLVVGIWIWSVVKPRG